MNKSNHPLIKELLRISRFYVLHGERIARVSGQFSDSVLDSQLHCDIFRAILSVQKVPHSKYIMSRDTMLEFTEKVPERILSDEDIVGHCEFEGKYTESGRSFDEVLFRKSGNNIHLFYISSDAVIKRSLPIDSFPNKHFPLISNMLAYICIKVADPEIYKEADIVLGGAKSFTKATRIFSGVLNDRKYWKMQHYGKKNSMRRKRLVDPDKNGKITARILRSQAL